MSSSSLPLSFNPFPSSYHKSSPIILSAFNLINNNNNILTFTKRTPKSHICFTFNNNSSEYEREEIRWLREEQRWIREQHRLDAEKESLLNEIKALKLQIEELIREGDDNNNINSVTKLLRVLKKEVSQIAETGTSAVPLVLEAVEDVTDEAVEDVEEVVVKEVVRVEDKEVKDDEVIIKRITLRMGSEGDQVQMLQEALLKLGFYCGEEDEEFASFSSGTERAVKTWQSSIGVPETGIMTAELLERLFIDQQDKSSAIKGSNGVAATQTPEIPLRVVKPDPNEHRVFLLGENRWEDSSRLKNRSGQSQPNSKGVVKTKCITCRGEGRLLCLECDGTGEPNIEPQFLEWIGEDTKCAYCEGNGHTICDSCQGTGIGAA
ncbi:protein disulfide isomerase pTAC5, chloroplastic-like isoform X2 [Bidens hawaiensis]|uniref:protein disulfide isomerase pTAC5, chloroplastic-like isoform X2 n=1 Tax=Bidens hawaiensis TaxID=980011 RepID=UPI004049019F